VTPLSFTTPDCSASPCAAGAARLPLSATCGCGTPTLYQLQISLDALYFLPLQAAFSAALAASLGVSPAQTSVLNATAFGDVTVIWLQLLPSSPLPLSASQVLNATAVLANCLGVNASAALPLCAGTALPPVFGALTVLSAPAIPGPPTTHIVDSTRPQGAVFPRFVATDPGLTRQQWMKPSPRAEAPGVDAFAFIAFGATLGPPGMQVPCTACTYACRLDFSAWVQSCISPFTANGLTPGEHFFQVVATAPDGSSDPQAAFHAWAIAPVPWVRYDATPGGATNASQGVSFNLTAAPGCVVVQYSLDGGATWTPVAGFTPSSSSGQGGSDGLGGEGNTSAVSLPLSLAGRGDGLVTLAVQCVTASAGVSVPAGFAFTLDTHAPVAKLAPGNFSSAVATHAPALSWSLAVSDTDALGNAGSGVVLVEYRLVDPTTNATLPGFANWTACSAAACTGSSIAVGGLLALTSGTYALQARATDAAGNTGAPGVAAFTVDVLVPLAPSIALSVTTTLGQATTPGALVVTPGDGVTAYFYITNVTGGLLALPNGTALTSASSGTFVTLADGTTGLVFTPTTPLFTGDVLGSAFGFSIQAADATQSRLSVPPLRVNITVQGINIPPVVDPHYLFTLDDVFLTGLGARSSAQGTTVSAILVGGLSDVNPSAQVGIAVLVASSELGAWEGTVTGGTTWLALASTTAAAPILLGPSAKLRFTPDLTVPLVGGSILADWAGSASLAFVAWDGTDGGVPGTSTALVGVQSAAAAAAAALNSTLAALIASAANGTQVAIPVNTTYAVPGAYSADVAALTVTLRGAPAAALVRNTPDQTFASRLAAEAAAQAALGCNPPQPGAVELLPGRRGVARLVANATGLPLADVGNTSWTVEAWVMKRARLASHVLFASTNTSDVSSGGGALLLEAGPTTWQIGVRPPGASPSGSDDVALGVEAPIGVWSHLAFVYDATAKTLSLLANGTAVNNVSLAATPMALPLGWLGSPVAPSAFVVDNIRLWTVARTAPQVEAAGNSLLPAPSLGANTAMLWPDVAGLLASWSCQEQCGSQAYAAGGTNLTLQLMGGALWAPGLQLACATVDGTQPVGGPVLGGGLVTLLGSGFPFASSSGALPTAQCVFLDSAGGHPTFARAVNVNSTSVTCNTPPSSTGADLARVAYVDTALGCFAPSQESVTYQYTGGGVIDAVEPVTGPAVGGTLLTVAGRSLLPADGLPLCRFTTWRASHSNSSGTNAAALVAVSPGHSWSSSFVACFTPPWPGGTTTSPAAVRIDVSLNGGASWVAAPAAAVFTYTFPMPRVVALPLVLPPLNTSLVNRSHVKAHKNSTTRNGAPLPSGPTVGGAVLGFDTPPTEASHDAPAGYYSPAACGFGTTRPVTSRPVGHVSAACISPAHVGGPCHLSISDNGRDWMFATPPRKAVIDADVALPRKFIVHNPPAVDALWPEIVLTSGGTALTVLGSGGSTAADLACVFGPGEAATSAVPHTRRGLRISFGTGALCMSPALGPGFVALRARGDGVVAPGGLQVLVREPPAVWSLVAPERADVGGGGIVWVAGAHFHAAELACVFDTTSAPALLVVSSVLAACEAPAARQPNATRVAATLWQPPIGTAAIQPLSASSAGSLLLEFAAPLAAIAVTPALSASVGGERLSIAVSDLAETAAAALCAFGTVRASALQVTSTDTGSLTCVSPAMTPGALVSICVGWSPQGVTCAGGVTLQYVAQTQLMASYADPLPVIVPATGATPVDLWLDFTRAAAPGLTCYFAGVSPSGDGAHQAAVVDTSLAFARCMAPPAATPAGGFVVLRLVQADASGHSFMSLAEAVTQLAFAPAARVLSVNLPRGGAGDKVIPGCLNWQAWPLAVLGTHLPQDPTLACRFAADDTSAQLGAWVSTAMVWCDMSDALVIPTADSHLWLSGASSTWSSMSAGPKYSWPIPPEVTDDTESAMVCGAA
jgi:hypothetical protein